MLNTELAAGEQIRTIPGENVALMKVNFGLPDADTYGKETLSKIRMSLGTEKIVLGSYLLLANGNIRVDLRLQDAIAGETLASFSEKGNQSQLDDIVSRAATVFRAKLGAREISTIEAAEAKAAQSPNPEAARLYAEGSAKLRGYDLLGARDSLQKAVEAAPEFSLAHSALAAAWHSLGYDEKAKSEARKAVDLSSNLSREDRLFIEGRFEELSNQWDKAIETYRSLSRLYPDNLDYGLRLSNVQIRSGNSHDALDSLAALRRLPTSLSNDPRIDYAETVAAESLGDFRQARIAASRAVDKAEAVGNRMLVARIKDRECWVLHNLGEEKLAAEACEQAQQLYTALGDRGSLAHTLNNIGNMSADAGELKAAVKTYERSLSICKEVGCMEEQAWALNNLGTVLQEEGELSSASSHFQEARKIFREIQARGGLASATTNLAVVSQQRGDFKQAGSLFEEALAIQRERADKRRVCLIQSNRAILLFIQGDLKSARAAADESFEVARDTGNKSQMAHALSHVGAVLRARGELDAARVKIDQWLSLERDLGEKANIADAQLFLASLSIDQGRPAEAESLAHNVIESSRAAKDLVHEISGLAVLAQALFARGKRDEARLQINLALMRSENNKAHDVDLALATARIQAGSGSITEIRNMLTAYALDARKKMRVADELAIRLAAGETELNAGQLSQGQGHLRALAKDARAKDFLLIAAKADQAVEQGVPRQVAQP
jgi:tetratricopeptide (TPR) repeat protein